MKASNKDLLEDSQMDASNQPNLGLATTQQLIEELLARAQVSASIGEQWPHYTTVDQGK